MKQVYLIWKDYGYGDYMLLGVHETAAGASAEIGKLFKESADEGKSPSWGNSTLTSENGAVDYGPGDFAVDSHYEVEVQRFPLKD